MFPCRQTTKDSPTHTEKTERNLYTSAYTQARMDGRAYRSQLAQLEVSCARRTERISQPPPPLPKGPLFFKYLFYIFHLFLFPYAFFHCPVRILLEKILLFSLSLSLSFLYLLCRSLSISLWERRHSGFLWAERPFLSSHMECCRSFRLITLERGSIYRRCSPKISPLSLCQKMNMTSVDESTSRVSAPYRHFYWFIGRRFNHHQ